MANLSMHTEVLMYSYAYIKNCIYDKKQMTEFLYATVKFILNRDKYFYSVLSPYIAEHTFSFCRIKALCIIVYDLRGE